MIRSVAYFLKRSLANMRGEGVATLLTLMVVTISFLILGTYITLGLNLSRFVDYFAGHVQVVLYLDKEVSAEEVDALIRALSAEDQVVKVSYMTGEQALARMRVDLADAPDFLRGVEELSIPPSLEVELGVDFYQRPNLKEIVEKYRHAAGVDSIDAGDEFTDAFARLLAGLWFAGSAIAVFLMFSAMFIVANTIRLTIIRHRDEIENMRLVGATNFFVTTPFLIEGVLVGAAGALFAWVMLFALFRGLILPFVADAPAMSIMSGFDPSFMPIPLLALQMVMGAVVGFLGAQLSVGRYLRVSR